MKQQNFSNHRQLVPLYHFIFLPICLVLIIFSTISLQRHCSYGQGKMIPSLLLLGSVALLILGLLARTFALKAQDRAIRAEENLRHFVATGKLFDSRLKLSQIIALRFASDDEFLALAKSSAENGASANDIKKAIQTWKADKHRV